MDTWASNKLPERLPFSKKKLSKRVIASYILDYFIIVILIVIFYAVDKIPPFHQHFSLQNYTLHYPFATKERVPVFQLCLICVAFPAVAIGFYTLVIDGIFSHKPRSTMDRTGLKRFTGRYRLKDRLWELNCGILGLGLSVSAAFTITGALKNAIGKPRPDLIDRCQVREGITGDPDSWRLSTSDICTQRDSYILNDGFKSFPSGHASTAFAGLYYLSLYLAAKLHVLDSKGEVWKSFIVMVPTLSAALVAGTRIMDARHHPFDVLSGSLLGILVAWGSYRQYFPPVSETWHKGRAFPIRSWGKGQAAPGDRFQIDDDDVEPLRPVHGLSDAERGEASGFSTQPVVAGSDEHNGNVFRQQVSASQRRRQENGQFTIPHTDTMGSTISAKQQRYQNQLPNSNPFAGEASHRRGHDEFDYSSSEDGSNYGNNYELQPTYTLSAPQSGGAYNPVTGNFADTGYHPPTGTSPNPSPPPPLNLSGAHKPPTASATADAGVPKTEPGPTVPPHTHGTT